MFNYKGKDLYCENARMADIAEQFGTPVYVYSANTIRRRVAEIKDVFSSIPCHTISYAVKVNNNLSLLKLLAEEGVGADIISAGELYRYLAAGGDHSKVMFAGVAKSREEICYAIDRCISMFNVESIPELIRLNEIAKSKNAVVNAAIRINPDVEAGTHDKITTGKSGGKFGVSVKTLKDNLKLIQTLANVKLIGLDMHIGSQILSAEPYIKAYKVMAETVKDLRASGFNISTVDVGGGFGIPYEKDAKGFDFESLKKDAIPVLKSLDAKIIIEPGRFIMAESGALLMNVEYVKQEWGKNFVILNGGMNDYLRVALYDAYNEILPAVKRDGTMKADIVGPICESSDFFAKDRIIGSVQEGDSVAMLDAGGYGMSMASNYNGRPFIAEVLVDVDDVKLIRRRQTVEEMTTYEKDFI